ncbi:MAG: TIR domain-containing protein [Candidatus Electronema sp. V4]|uniref:TIR domain-containing protein n=1 Tax=Candidatus Electronema sp. V4 TaxID=3454756 RepID=UPI0040558103
MKPRMFIGSSVEGKEIAEYLQLGLEYDVETTIWHQGIFGLSDGSLESLVKAAKDFDFAALVLTPDDLVTERGTEKASPRDNVVFELGLFMGALGRERTFIVYNRDKKPNLPSDLAGVTSATFASHSDNNLQAALGPVCTKIKLAIKKCGLKAGHAAEAEAPAPATKSEPSTVVVDRQGKGDYETISDALWEVKPGTRILVRPGLYKESIEIDKSVKIEGDGKRKEIIIEADGTSAIVFNSDNGRVANLTLTQPNDSTWPCVEIVQGMFELEGCDISSQGACVVIHDSTNLLLCDNHIHNGNGDGIVVYGNNKVTLENNKIVANVGHGVLISGGSKPTLRRNRISQNSGVGIWVYEGGGGIFEDNVFRNNAEGAWYIAPDCEANVQRRDNKE